MIFCLERLHDFVCGEVADFSHKLLTHSGCMNYFCGGHMIFFERLQDFIVCVEVARFFVDRLHDLFVERLCDFFC